jgi:hypothetical protein
MNSSRPVISSPDSPPPKEIELASNKKKATLMAIWILLPAKLGKYRICICNPLTTVAIMITQTGVGLDRLWTALGLTINLVILVCISVPYIK